MTIRNKFLDDTISPSQVTQQLISGKMTRRLEATLARISKFFILFFLFFFDKFHNAPHILTCYR